MNNYLKTILAVLCLSTNVWAQSSKDIASIKIEQPSVQKQGDPYLRIMSVTIDKQVTKVDFLYKTNDASITMIPEQPHKYLQIVDEDGNVYKGVKSSSQQYRGYVQPGREQWFAVAFEKIPFDVISFDLVENESGVPGLYHLPKWNFINVRLKTDAQLRAELNRLKQEADGGDADAAYDLAMKYRKGKGVAKDEAIALKYLQTSAENGNNAAKYAVAIAMLDGTLPADPEKTYTYMLQLAMGGQADAQYYMSRFCEEGYGTPKNEEAAQNWLSASAENGNPYGQYLLGSKAYSNGSYDKAFEWFQKSAMQGYAVAQCDLGSLYYWGRGTAKNNNKAFEWFQYSADNGYGWGQRWLGHMFHYGYGTSKDRDEALKWYRKALATTSNNELKSVVYNDMGNLYYEKEYEGGASYDIAQAIRSYTQAAELNNPYACCSLGRLYKTGSGVLKNPAKAKELFEKSAGLGNSEAQYELGLLCKEKTDLPGAYKWMKQSAENGYAPAQYELGLMYYYGKGTVKNTKSAALWIEKSFEAGNEEAKKVWNGLQLWKYK